MEETQNQRAVTILYEALRNRDANTVHGLLASDLDWWFHGPPSHQFMMSLLTGTTLHNFFEFIPQTVVVLGSTVLVEGSNQERSISWVHAWTFNATGVITHVREYINTSVTVTQLGDRTNTLSSEITTFHCAPIWKSSHTENSVPGIVLVL
ncbi:Wound-induced protein 1 [Heracleum sosnowskyi]|uniref:Wound-induced protein 1 n=1 Tax=Heracleum sosnowskyi TaxID=360622 RepID=A0AAD8IMB9_9APIA|nr:Wound-induced protein 1 [Heracleum sosnowskyi]